MRGLIVVERVRSESRRSLRVCSVFSSGRFGVAGVGCWWLAFVLVAWGVFHLDGLGPVLVPGLWIYVILL